MLQRSTLFVSTLQVSTVLLLAGTSPGMAQERLVDLTHPFNQETIYWPTESGFVLERGTAGFTERGYFYAANRFIAPEHGGTHIDAPHHFYQEGQTLEEIPLKRLIGEAVCVDVADKCTEQRDYQVTVEDFRTWETEQSVSLESKIVLIRTGWAKYWPDRSTYLGTNQTGRAAVSQLHFPGLHPAAATWLARQREIMLVGIDTASIDFGPSREFRSHVNLFQHNVPALENLANLEAVPAKGFRIAALPMKIEEGSGGPCRIVAMVAENSRSEP